MKEQKPTYRRGEPFTFVFSGHFNHVIGCKAEAWCISIDRSLSPLNFQLIDFKFLLFRGTQTSNKESV